MALSLGWHIIIACFGVGFPAFVLLAEWRGHRTGDPAWDRLARRWAKALAVLFAVGAVSGTILSFELGILWPRMMGTFGDVWGLPFTIEGIAFFVEAIFIGIYLYGWDRLSPRAHLLFGLPIPIAGVASAWFVVTANAWMNHPAGFDIDRFRRSGRVADVDPLAAMFNRAVPVQTTHMILAAFMVAGFGTASVYAWAWLRGRRDRHCALGFLLPFAIAAAITPVQLVVGDWAARFIAESQPVKLAALEGLEQTQSHAPLSILGLVEVPSGLSLLTHHDPDAVVIGLDSVPAKDRPPVLPVRVAFQAMVAIGFSLLGLAGWFALAWRRRREIPSSPLFLWGAVAAGPAAVLALEAGWVVTEVGRQPWIVYGVMRVGDAVTRAPNIRFAYWALLVVYSVMTVATIVVLRRLAREPVT
jgi:cytochrome d ubiquinol oxidase subunit I